MDIDTINEFTMLKHSIFPGTQQDSILNIARNHLGLHSARIITPYTTLCSRLTNYNPELLTSHLFKKRNLIKMRCMRTTLHTVPFDIVSILHNATLDLRLAQCKLFFRRNNISIDFIDELENYLIDAINKPETGYVLEQIIAKKINCSWDLQKECAKIVLKYFWERGVLCYVNTADNWENEERKYAVTKSFYPDLDFKKMDPQTAQRLLALEYIEKYGPATIKDFSWWSGLSGKIIRDVITQNKDSIVAMKVNDFESDFYTTTSDYCKLNNFRKADLEWVTLLAYEDPSLKGYYESRYRYVDKKYYNLLFNQIGEVRASIIHNGKAIGVWEWDRKNKYIHTNFFSDPSFPTKQKVKQIKERFEQILYPCQQFSLFK